MFQENVRSLRKRKNISYDDNVHSRAEDSYLEESAENPDDTRVLAEASSVTMKVKIEGKTPARKKRQLNNKENVSSANMMQQSDTGLTINEALDILASNNQWVGADLFMTPPEDANCSDEDLADEEDPHLHNLSKKQLLAQCQLRLRENGSDEMIEIDSDKEQIGESSTSQSSSSSAKASTSSASITTIAKASTTANICKPSKGENEKQMELREKVETFKAPKNLEIERLDNENHNWSHVRCFELFFDNEYVDHIVQMSNQYAIEKSATIVMHILPNISRSKDNQTMKFGQLTECNMRNIFPEKSSTKYDKETSLRTFSEKLKLNISLYQ